MELYFLLYPLEIYTGIGYNIAMIKNFADKETEKIYDQIFSKKLPHDIQRVALRKMGIIFMRSRLLTIIKI